MEYYLTEGDRLELVAIAAALAQRDGEDGYLVGRIDRLCKIIQHQKDTRQAMGIYTAEDGIKLALYVWAMRNDTHLTGHPEWAEIVADARGVLMGLDGPLYTAAIDMAGVLDMDTAGVSSTLRGGLTDMALEEWEHASADECPHGSESDWRGAVRAVITFGHDPFAGTTGPGYVFVRFYPDV